MLEAKSCVGATVAAPPPLVSVKFAGVVSAAQNAIERANTPAAVVGRVCIAAAGVVEGSSIAAANDDAVCDTTSEVTLGRCGVGDADDSAISVAAMKSEYQCMRIV